VRRRIEFDAATWHALHKLSLDSMKSLQDLVDETISGLAEEASPAGHAHEMLRESTRSQPANDHGMPGNKRG
jgi:hypothetical protein